MGRILALAVAIAAYGAGCEAGADAAAEAEADTADAAADLPGEVAPAAYPLDDVLGFEHVQALGSHNSYHVEPEYSIPPWAYSHLPLDRQAAEQGIRQFELDAWYDRQEKALRVYHVPFLDDVSTCDRFDDCVADLKAFSDANPGHHPLHVLVELKDNLPTKGTLAADTITALEQGLLSVWPRERLITPDDVRQGEATVPEGIARWGWPRLGELRGRAMFVLHDGGAWRNLYTADHPATEGRALFAEAYGDLDAPFAAHHTINDPLGSFDRIREVVAAGHLVRTRADTDSEQVATGDYSRYEAALESGAHFITTDHPGVPGEGVYRVHIPGGTPSRCNPITAPPECTSAAIEDPALLQLEP